MQPYQERRSVCGIDCTERQIRSQEDSFAKVSNMIQT
jgi:hypothetical protein